MGRGGMDAWRSRPPGHPGDNPPHLGSSPEFSNASCSEAVRPPGRARERVLLRRLVGGAGRGRGGGAELLRLAYGRATVLRAAAGRRRRRAGFGGAAPGGIVRAELRRPALVLLAIAGTTGRRRAARFLPGGRGRIAGTGAGPVGACRGVGRSRPSTRR